MGAPVYSRLTRSRGDKLDLRLGESGWLGEAGGLMGLSP